MSESVIRSRTIGLRDVHVAVVTENTPQTYTTEKPIRIAKAIKGKITDKYSSEKIHGDDGVEDVISSFEGTEVEFEVSSLAPQDRQLLFGQLYKNGFLLKNKDDIPPEVAVGYRAKRLNRKYEFVWLYSGKFDQGNEDQYETQSDKIAPQTATLKGSFYERQMDGNYHISVDEQNLNVNTDEDAKNAISNWFEKVQEAKKGNA